MVASDVQPSQRATSVLIVQPATFRGKPQQSVDCEAVEFGEGAGDWNMQERGSRGQIAGNLHAKSKTFTMINNLTELFCLSFWIYYP